MHVVEDAPPVGTAADEHGARAVGGRVREARRGRRARRRQQADGEVAEANGDELSGHGPVAHDAAKHEGDAARDDGGVGMAAEEAEGLPRRGERAGKLLLGAGSRRTHRRLPASHLRREAVGGALASRRGLRGLAVGARGGGGLLGEGLHVGVGDEPVRALADPPRPLRALQRLRQEVDHRHPPHDAAVLVQPEDVQAVLRPGEGLVDAGLAAEAEHRPRRRRRRRAERIRPPPPPKPTSLAAGAAAGGAAAGAGLAP